MNVSVWRWETGTKTRPPVLQSPPTTTLHFPKKLAFKSHFEVVCLGCRFNRSGGPSLDVCYGWTIIAQSAEPTPWSQSQKKRKTRVLVAVAQTQWVLCRGCLPTDLKWLSPLQWQHWCIIILPCVFKTFECFLAAPQQKREQPTV